MNVDLATIVGGKIVSESTSMQQAAYSPKAASNVPNQRKVDA